MNTEIHSKLARWLQTECLGDKYCYNCKYYIDGVDDESCTECRWTLGDEEAMYIVSFIVREYEKSKSFKRAAEVFGFVDDGAFEQTLQSAT